MITKFLIIISIVASLSLLFCCYALYMCLDEQFLQQINKRNTKQVTVITSLSLKLELTNANKFCLSCRDEVMRVQTG